MRNWKYHFMPDLEVLDRLEDIKQQLDLVLYNQEQIIMPTLDELQTKAEATLAQVTADTDLDNAVAKVVTAQNATISDLKAQLTAAGTDAVKLQALSDTMDAVLKADTSNAALVTAAVTAGTPAPVTAASS